MKTVLKMAVGFAFMSACAAHGAVSVKGSTGDISVGTTWTGDSVPNADIADFNTSGGAYTAANDVSLGSVRIRQNTTFNLDASGNHTIRTAKFYFGWYNRTANVNGGVWDLSGTLAEDVDKAPNGAFYVGNLNAAVYNCTVTLAKGCIVTNATSIRIGHSERNNTLKITDESRIHASGSTLWVNPASVNGLLEISSGGLLCITGALYDGMAGSATYQVLADTTNRIVVAGSGSKLSSSNGFYLGNAYGRNSLLVSDGGELVAQNRFAVGYSANANTNSAVFETNAKFSIRDIRVGENGSCGNMLEFRSGASGTVDAGGRIGGYSVAGSDNTMLVSNATVSATGVIGVGAASGDAPSISGNGLIMQGSTPSLEVTSSLLVKNRSFIRIEIPAGGYAADFTPITANSVTIDNTSSLDVIVPDVDGMPDCQRLISTSNGITIPDSVMVSARARVSLQSGGNLRLAKADGGKSIVLRAVKGLIILSE